MQLTIEFGFSSANVTCAGTVSSSASAPAAANAALSPTMSSSVSQWRSRRASASGVEPIASVWANVASVMRAVCSARST